MPNNAPTAPMSPLDNSHLGRSLLSVAAVAKVLGSSRDLVEKLIRKGDLPAVDVSAGFGKSGHRSTWRVHPADLDVFLQTRQLHRDPVPTRARRGQGAIGKPHDFIP